MAKGVFLIYLTSAGVDKLVSGLDNPLDLSVLLELVDGTAGQRGADLKTIRDDGGGDELVGGDILHHLVVQLLVIDNDLLDVLLDLGLGPLLLND